MEVVVPPANEYYYRIPSFQEEKYPVLKIIPGNTYNIDDLKNRLIITYTKLKSKNFSLENHTFSKMYCISVSSHNKGYFSKKTHYFSSKKKFTAEFFFPSI